MLISFFKIIIKLKLPFVFQKDNCPQSDLIKVKIKLFAVYQETFGQEELELQIPAQTSVIKVLETLITDKPQLQKWVNLTRFGINLEFVESDTMVKDGDEIVFIPPVSGG